MSAPYYSDDAVTLYLGDWRELIPECFTADLILTDPPYGETSLEWDRWPDGWPALAARHANAMWCWGSMRMFLDRRDEFAAWTYSQDTVWEKHNGSGFAADRFKRVHELSLFWYRGRWEDIHHEAPRIDGGSGNKSVRKRGLTPHTGAIGDTGYIDDGQRIVRSVMRAHSLQQRALNETQKPESVTEHLLTYGCPVGGTVLDLFAGSGTTLAVAKRTGRKAIGFEIREQQCERSALRLSQDVLGAAS